VREHSVAVVDPATNTVVAGVGVGAWPGPVATGNGFVWVGNTGEDTVSRIDPRTRVVLDSFTATTPIDIAVAGSAAWIGNGNSLDGPDPPGGGTVERYALDATDLRSTRVGPAVRGGAEQTVVAAGAEGVWAANRAAGSAYRLDARTGAVVATVGRAIDVGGIAVGEGAVWVTDTRRDLVLRIDADSGRVAARIPVADGPTRIAVGPEAIWVVVRSPSGVWRINPRNDRAIARVPIPERAGRIAADGDAVWVTSNVPGQPGPGYLSRIDPETSEVVATVELGSFRPDGVGVANGLVWVAIAPR
jgi:virginiamycin B lyase